MRQQLCWLGIAVGAIGAVACSSSPPAQLGPPAGFDAGVIDTGALPVLDGGADAGVAEACRAFARAACAFKQRCTIGSLMLIDGTIAHCEAEALEACTWIVALPGSKKSGAVLSQCATAYETAPCDQPPFYFAEPCQPTVGDLPNGAGCASGSQCQGRACIMGGAEVCGLCGQLRNVGEPCQNASQCAGAAACRAGVCAISTAGATCDENNLCSAPQVCVEGKCYARLLVEGEACNVNADYCDDEKGFACNSFTSKCAPITFVTQGTCGGLPSGGNVACTYPAACLVGTGSQGTCAAALPDGSACSVSSGAYCVSTCIPTSPGSDSGKCGPEATTTCK